MRTKLFLVIAVVLVATLALAGWLMLRKDKQYDLIVTSPHSEDVQKEFERAFSAWHEAKFGQPVSIQWRDIGGTTNITKYIKSRGELSGLDVYFGGGGPDHKSLAKLGLLDPVPLPQDVLDQMVPVGDIPQYDAEGGWYGACMSSFGILYNAALLKQKELSAPATWDDLAEKAMWDYTAAAGPESGSGRASYELMIQTAGDWPTGWRRLLGFWGNCQRFTAGASDIPRLVGNGQVLAGTCIDYYAFAQIQSTPGALKFLLPKGGAVFTPDPISVLKGAPHPDMAQRFVQFVLSPEGQALWCLPVGAPGGPTEKALFRQPVRKDAYTKYAGKMLPDLVNPYDTAGDFRLDLKVQAARVSSILPDLMQAAAVDNAELLHKAWKVVLDKSKPADLLDEFSRLPDNLATVDKLLETAGKIAEAEENHDEKFRSELSAGWREFFRTKYESIISKQ